MQEVIGVKNLIKRYRKAEKNAVDGVSFSVQEGQLFALLGPNGAGKTTTISILTTTLSKTSGEVHIAGFDIEKQETEVRQRIGVIFQNPSLDKNLTAEENVRFHASLYGLYPFRPTFGLMPRTYKDKIFELAELVDIKKEIFDPIKTYSGGMKRKLEIIRGLMHNPKVLFLDEPTTGLDPLSRRNVWQYLKSVREKEKVTIFLTTHYLEEAEDADQIYIINHGKIVSHGTAREISKDLIREYLLIEAEDSTRLKGELQGLGVTPTEEEGGLLRIDLNPERTAQKVIRSIQTPLTTLKIHTPTLEEAYLEIISKGTEEHNQ